jgi:hypothetical protein
MNVFQTLPALVLALVLALVTASPAEASDVSLSLHGKHGSFGIHLNDFGHYAPVPRPIRYTQREWIPGHYETIQERVWVEGRQERVWVEPIYQWHYEPCGRAYRVCVQEGYWNTVCTPGHFENRSRQVWVEGGWRVMPCAY